MNLRGKLLLIFSVSAFSALAFFGYVAFDTASRQSEKKEAVALYEIFAQDIHRVTDAISHGLEPRRAVADAKLDDLLSFVVYDVDRRPIYVAKELSSLPPEEFERLPLKAGMGVFSVSNTRYQWYTSQVPDTDLVVAALYQHGAGENESFLSQMAVTLAFTAFIVLWAAGWSAMYIASMVDKLKAQKLELEKLATHDSLTGLPNRSLLHDRVDQSMLRATRAKSSFALCFVDLNRFKEVNDRLGHLYGDQLLKEVSGRLFSTVRASDTVARLGGDEFAVLLNNTHREGAEAVVKKLAEAIEQPIMLQGKSYHVSGSIGIALYPAHGSDAQTVIKHADDAMYIAKKSGKRFVHYGDALEAQTNASKRDEAPASEGATSSFSPELANS